jgi:AmmeMemoRadiSam system protein B
MGAVLALWLLLTAASVCSAEPFPAFYPDAGLFTAALARKAPPAIPWRVTGLTVPHHLLAVDLLADAFARLDGQDYHRVIILCPDHFRRAKAPFAVAGRDFQSCLGTVAVDAEAVERLRACPLVEVSELFAKEHGIQALTPFLARRFPQAKLVAVAIRRNTTPGQWDTLGAALAPLLDDKTLLIESTDFSHYLPPAAATRLDQQTLRLLADPDPAKLAALKQPRHVDSRGALYLQRKLQQDIHAATPVTVASRNSQYYAKTPVTRSTSYLVQYYGPDPTPLPGGQRFVFAGDVFFGRFMAKLLARPGKRRELVRLVRQATDGAPLVVNLEGVLRPRCPDLPGPHTLCMATRPSLALLRELGVKAAVLANNHTNDLGPAARARMARSLRRAGITPILAGQTRDLGPFRLAALTDLDNSDPRRSNLLARADLDRLAKPGAAKPLFVMLHWGLEFAPGPGQREQTLADTLIRAGAQCIIGAHPHRAWPLTCDATACQAWSLGNFLFDQSRPEADGALLEVRFFPQGTYALRLIPFGNPYRRLAQ